MQLTDPNRPQINGAPAYLDRSAVVASLSVTPLSATACEISALLPVAPLEFAYRYQTVQMCDLPHWFESFHNDPEQTLADTFNWYLPQRKENPLWKLKL